MSAEFTCPWCRGDGHGDHAVDCAKRETHPLDPRRTTDPALRALLALRITTGYEGEWERGFNAALDRVADEVLSLPGWERAAYAPALAAAEAAPLDVERLAAADARVMTARKLPYWMPASYWPELAREYAALAATSPSDE